MPAQAGPQFPGLSPSLETPTPIRCLLLSPLWWAPPGFLLILPLIVLRHFNEEKVLRRDLAGYSDDCLRTRFRLLPLLR